MSMPYGVNVISTDKTVAHMNSQISQPIADADIIQVLAPSHNEECVMAADIR